MKSIGIVVAMEEEKEEVLKLLNDVTIKKIYELEFLIGTLNNKKCILVKCGVGKVNAARTTQILIGNFDINFVINVGVAGAVNSDLNIGDVIIGKYVVQHDFDITAFGHNKGYISDIGEKFECDKTIIDSAKLDDTKNADYKIKDGVVATGDIFCTEVKMKNKINSKFNADVVDMECAAMAQVCYLDNISFAVIRSVSDVPNGNNANDFDTNLKLACERFAEVLIKVI